MTVSYKPDFNLFNGKPENELTASSAAPPPNPLLHSKLHYPDTT